MPWFLLLAVFGCEPSQSLNSTPPGSPVHDAFEHDVPHARGKDTPFLCSSANGMRACPDDLRPEQANLSCDASGCHGDTVYDPAVAPERHLLGSDGPSCYTCHVQLWSDRKEPR